MTSTGPVVLCILDGWGDRAESVGNAPALARTPTFDALSQTGPRAQLVTHGPDVGLPTGQMGNSEVGHTNIGAGRVVAMDLGQIDLSIEDGSFQENSAILDLIAKTKAARGRAHILGVVSDGGVHGSLDHMLAAVQMVSAKVPVVIHAVTDGRDVGPKTADGFIDALVADLPEGASIGTVTGRYYAMDRDNRWERVETAYRAMAFGDGKATASDAVMAVTQGYAADLTDEFLPATVLDGYAGMEPGDSLFCLNFRADRAREILAAFAAPEFEGFDRGARLEMSACLGMVSYSDAHDTYMTTAFPKRALPNTLGEWVAKHGKRQFRLAETEKYPHVTFFMNGGVEVPNEGEARFMPKSPEVATYDLQPEMSSAEVTEQFVAALGEGYDLIIVNYANPDMVGHTGDLKAAIAACEAVDQGLAQVVEALKEVGGRMILTADHGNCEMMIDPKTGGPHTAHTTNLVPVILVGGPDGATLSDGRLADLAPTVLALMGLPQPPEMTGTSLLG